MGKGKRAEWKKAKMRFLTDSRGNVSRRPTEWHSTTMSSSIHHKIALYGVATISRLLKIYASCAEYRLYYRAL